MCSECAKVGGQKGDLAYEHLDLALQFIAEALEITNSNYAEMESFEIKYTEGWNYKTNREAAMLLNAATSSEYVVSLSGLYRLLHPLASITNRLQVRGVDIIKGYDDI